MLPLHHDPGRDTSCRGMRLSPDHRLGPRYDFCRESGRPDSNRRSQAPRACGLARLSHALIVPASSPCGNRTHLSALKGRYPRPIDERASFRRVGRVALESTSAALQAAARPSQLPAHPTKRPGCLVTPGPGRTVEVASAGASQAQRMDGQRIRRLTGETTRSRSLTEVTGPPGKHRDLGRLGASSRFGEAAHLGHRLALHATVDAGVAEDVRADSRLIPEGPRADRGRGFFRVVTRLRQDRRLQLFPGRVPAPARPS